MSGPRILTDAQLDEMCELREAGKTVRQIVRHFARQGIKVSGGSIDWQCLRLGAFRPGISLPGLYAARPCRRASGEVKPFTPAEDRQLLAMRKANAKYAEIARRIGRRENSVRGRILTLARYEALEALPPELANL